MKVLGSRESSGVFARACTAITGGSNACSYARSDMSTPATASAITPFVRQRVTRVSTHAPVFWNRVFIICVLTRIRSMLGHMRVSTHALVFQTGVLIGCILARTLSMLGHMCV